MMKAFEGKMKVFHPLADAERAVKEVLSLPIEPLQSSDDTRYVARCIRKWFRQ
jgi:dTDP-4-amino-4,6-dideoxygalactose transaminase